jgi:hypothetical protein
MSLASINKEEDSAAFRAILPVLLQQSDENKNFKIRVLSALLPVILRSGVRVAVRRVRGYR